MIKTILKGITCVIYYCLGHIAKWLFYDDKYFHSLYFTMGKYKGLSAPGWKMTFEDGLARLLLRTNTTVPWPVSFRIHVTCPENITFDPDDIRIFHTFGTYFQAINAHITIGKGTYIAPNVGIVTANHDPMCLDRHLPGKDVVIGEKCWIGMNSLILPGVILGPNTIVGGGSVVTKSFPEGNCVIAGNPAKIIKNK